MRSLATFAVLMIFVAAPTAEAGEADKLKCKTAYFQGSNVRITYGCDGSYVYQDGSMRHRGTYKINGNKVCVIFSNGRSRCDTISGTTLTNSQGQSYRFQLH